MGRSGPARRGALQPLPPARYEFAIWKGGKVNTDYHVAFDAHCYSAPLPAGVFSGAPPTIAVRIDSA
jgi:hypothetical protein